MCERRDVERSSMTGGAVKVSHRADRSVQVGSDTTLLGCLGGLSRGVCPGWKQID